MVASWLVSTNQASHIIEPGRSEFKFGWRQSVNRWWMQKFCSLPTMKQSWSDSIVPVNPNTPKKRRNKTLATYGQVLNFSNTLDSESPRSTHIHDAYSTLSSPWMPTPKFQNWGQDWGASTSSSDSALSSVHLAWTPGPSDTGNVNAGNISTNSTVWDNFASHMPPPVPLKSPPVLLELWRMVGHTTLGTSGMHEYKVFRCSSCSSKHMGRTWSHTPWMQLHIFDSVCFGGQFRNGLCHWQTLPPECQTYLASIYYWLDARDNCWASYPTLPVTLDTAAQTNEAKWKNKLKTLKKVQINI